MTAALVVALVGLCVALYSLASIALLEQEVRFQIEHTERQIAEIERELSK